MDTPYDQAIEISNDYESWEKASIELDIAIDEQDEKTCDNIVQCSETDLQNVLDLETQDEGRKRFWELLVDENGNVKLDINVRDQECSPDKFWTVFFLAKKLRAKLQCANTDTQSKKLDWVVDLLIKTAAFKISEDNTFQYLLLMLESAACTIGEQSLGFSEKAKAILPLVKNVEGKDFPEWKSYAYKALIHYNQGLAKAHMGHYHDALKEYDSGIEKYNDAKNSPGYPKSVDPHAWPKYVYYPTLLQRAVALIKMQFSYNALTTLEMIEIGDITLDRLSFPRARKELLKAECYIELENWDKFRKHFDETINKLNYFDGSLLVDPKRFIDATNPQNALNKRDLPWLLSSSYNALVQDGAKKELNDMVSDIRDKNISISANLRTRNFLHFLGEYIDQCRDNRFDSWTLKETILEYIKILTPLVKIEVRNNFHREKLVMRTVNRLMDFLDIKSFTEGEISPDTEPPMRRDCIEKAMKVFEDINDKILKQWFQIIQRSWHPKWLPKYLRKSFEFENELINTVLNRSDLLRKEFIRKSLEVRRRLLNKIAGAGRSYKSANVEYLRDNLVSICDDSTDENRKKCLEYVLDVIRDDAELENEKILRFADYDKILNRESRRFTKHMAGRSIQPLPLPGNQPNRGEESNYSVNYVGLRRWNSYTPELSFSVGGGHFVFLSNEREKNKGKVHIGIAVDPGFDFIRNFFRQGFTLTDIDLVLLTHGHPDHIRDFPAIVELLLENRKRRTSKTWNKKRIYAVMSLGCYQRLDEYIARDPFKLLFYDTFIVDIDKDDGQDSEPLRFSCYNQYDGMNENQPLKLITAESEPEGSVRLEIEFFKSFHDDHSESDSYGYIITFNGQNNRVSDNNSQRHKASVGFTGDSKWFPEYPKKFQKCDMICSHIGSIVEANKPGRKLGDYSFVGKAERLMRTKNHPYLFGEILFLQDWKKSFSQEKKTLVLISEFGEEMKGQIRSDLTNRLNRPREKSGCWLDLGLAPVSCNLLKNFSSTIPRNDCDKLAECKKGAENVFTIPVDVGLRISIPLESNKRNNNDFPGNVHCVLCDEFVRPERIKYEVYSHEEAMFYVCSSLCIHRRATCDIPAIS
ncbi:MAG: MBL fold metallo-hydrolase [Deltaproteobacteria bacterium]|nr:MBL fold metallo-hydrolase [Deltaproteobacteria bacterium]